MVGPFRRVENTEKKRLLGITGVIPASEVFDLLCNTPDLPCPVGIRTLPVEEPCIVTNRIAETRVFYMSCCFY